MTKSLAVLIILVTLFVKPGVSHAADLPAPVIFQSCYRFAPIVEVAWPVPVQGTRSVQVEFSSYVSFYQAFSTEPLPGTFTSTVFVGLADTTRLWYRVAYLQA